MEKRPKLNIAWVRGKGSIDWSQPNIFFAIGARGAAKSSFLELCATRCLDAGGKVVDVYASKDSENLAWLRSDYVTSGNRKAILFRGDHVAVKSNHESIATSQFKLSDLDRADIFISANACYSSMDDEFGGVNRILDTLWKRRSWTKPVCLIMREAANLVFSRLKIRPDQSLARSEIIYSCRESRHTGCGILLDSLKPTSIDIDLRILSDYLILKNSGMYSLSKDLHWVYKTFSPSEMRKLQPREFVIIDRFGSLGFGTFDMPAFHKLTGEDIAKITGVELEHFLGPVEGDELRGVILEAIQALPPESEPNQVSVWLRDNKGRAITPSSIGKQLKGLGYMTKDTWRDGKIRNLIYPLP
jgi:hypothetical protein